MRNCSSRQIEIERIRCTLALPPLHPEKCVCAVLHVFCCDWARTHRLPTCDRSRGRKNPQSGTAREVPIPCDLLVYLPCYFNKLRAGMRQLAFSCPWEGAGNNISSPGVGKTFPPFEWPSPVLSPPSGRVGWVRSGSSSEIASACRNPALSQVHKNDNQ